MQTRHGSVQQPLCSASPCRQAQHSSICADDNLNYKLSTADHLVDNNDVNNEGLFHVRRTWTSQSETLSSKNSCSLGKAPEVGSACYSKSNDADGASSRQLRAADLDKSASRRSSAVSPHFSNLMKFSLSPATSFFSPFAVPQVDDTNFVLGQPLVGKGWRSHGKRMSNQRECYEVRRPSSVAKIYQSSSPLLFSASGEDLPPPLPLFPNASTTPIGDIEEAFEEENSLIIFKPRFRPNYSNTNSGETRTIDDADEASPFERCVSLADVGRFDGEAQSFDSMGDIFGDNELTVDTKERRYGEISGHCRRGSRPHPTSQVVGFEGPLVEYPQPLLEGEEEAASISYQFALSFQKSDSNRGLVSTPQTAAAAIGTKHHLSSALDSPSPFICESLQSTGRQSEGKHNLKRESSLGSTGQSGGQSRDNNAEVNKPVALRILLGETDTAAQTPRSRGFWTSPSFLPRPQHFHSSNTVDDSGYIPTKAKYRRSGGGHIDHDAPSSVGDTPMCYFSIGGGGSGGKRVRGMQLVSSPLDPPTIGIARQITLANREIGQNDKHSRIEGGIRALADTCNTARQKEKKGRLPKNSSTASFHAMRMPSHLMGFAASASGGMPSIMSLSSSLVE